MKKSLTILFLVLSVSVYAHELTDNYPEFSWDRIPQYIHIRKAEAFTNEECQFLASFPLITLEKTTGSSTYGSTDQGSMMAAKSIKAINPNVKILYCRNVICHYGGNTFDKELKKLQSPFLTNNKNGKGKLIRGSVEAYDLSNKELRNWWVESAAKICNSKYIDGLFLDGNIKVLVPGFLLEEIGADKNAKVKDALEGHQLPDSLIKRGGLRLGLIYHSKYGISWGIPKIGYNTNKFYFNQELSRSERPHILWKDGKPECLFLANHGSKEAGFSLRIKGWNE